MDVGSIVGGQVVSAQGGELRIVEPRIAKPAELPVVLVGVDHLAILLGAPVRGEPMLHATNGTFVG